MSEFETKHRVSILFIMTRW